jgi:curved DNA-binding protein CbpA
MTKDHYRTLGVLEDAEDIVIKAAYRALAQKYHPDKWTGSLDESTARMAEINEAYTILSDPKKRIHYDSTRVKSEYEEDDLEEEGLGISLEKDWLEVVEFLPDLQEYSNQLSKISKQLDFAYKSILIESKRFNEYKDIARHLESQFLQKYFGKNEKIVNFAKNLILAGKKKMAKELNRAIELLGSDIDPDIVIRKIIDKSKDKKAPTKIREHYAREFLDSPSVYYAKRLIDEIGGYVLQSKYDLNLYTITYDGMKQEMTVKKLHEFTREIAKNILLQKS